MHIDPKTKLPYLENQFSRSQRSDVPKYIDFGADGTNWMCRIHTWRLGTEIEKNWSSDVCHREGKRLLKLIATEMETPIGVGNVEN